MAGAQRLKITGSRDFALSDLVLRVLEAEGLVQVQILREGSVLVANAFLNDAAPGQLRAMAAHLDGLADGTGVAA
jgi:hypothetical protein